MFEIKPLVFKAGINPELEEPAPETTGAGISQVKEQLFPIKVIALPVLEAKSVTLVRVPGLPLV